MITTDVIIVGAGPSGLFAVFQLGLLKLRCHLVDYLGQPGGQLSEIYPKKPIYDIPGYPSVSAQELVDQLLEQAQPFKPAFTLGERVEGLNKIGGRDFIVTTNLGTSIQAGAIVIAGGLGCFEPRKPAVLNLEQFENGKGIHYVITDPDAFTGKNILIAGGGDSALDWTLYLYKYASHLTLVHRSETFKANPDSVSKVLQLAEEKKITVLLHSQVIEASGKNHLEQVRVENIKTEDKLAFEVSEFIPLFGLSPKLGPLAHWNLNLHKNAIEVNPANCATSIPGIYAIGDINNYENKLKLILCGFHEAAMMSHAVYKYLFPENKYTMKYTTVNGIQSF